jgi:hypothetical protein
MHAKHVRQILCSCGQSRTAIGAGTTTRDCPASIRTVSHTLEGHLAERLRFVAYRERVSESAVIEYALRGLLVSDDSELGARMRDGGATLRRKVKTAPADSSSSPAR